MMNWGMWYMPNPYLRYGNTLWNPWETVLASSYGRDSKHQTESGSDSTPKYSLQKERNTLTKLTSGHNTITIHTMLDPRRLKENSSNTMTPTTSSAETVSGSLKTIDSTLSQQSTSPTPSVKGRTRRR